MKMAFLPLISLLTLLFSWTANAGRPIEELSWGRPAHEGKDIPDATYVEVKAKRLAHARVLWLNFDWLHQHGFEIPPEGMTPDFEERILSALAYQVPRSWDPPEAFQSTEKVFFADRYGGDGMNNNWGSGRAASAGQVQIKGIGRTSLVSPSADFDHAHGGASIQEGMKEPVLAEMNDELPYGSNPIIAILETGTYAPWDHAGEDQLALVVREDPVRLAHFVRREAHEGDGHPGNDANKHGEWERQQAIKRKVMDMLPIPEQARSASPRGKYVAGVEELARRIGRQTAAAYARGLYHGTTTASNLLASGGFIDYGTQSYQPGFARVKSMDEVAPAGVEEAREVAEALAATLAHVPEEVEHSAGPRLPDVKRLQNLAETAYHQQLEHEMLLLTGIPEDLVARLEGTPEAKKLASTLIRVAEDAAGEMVIKNHIPDRLTRFDLREILTRLGAVANGPLAAIESVLDDEMALRDGEMSMPAFRKRLATRYQAFFRKTADLAKESGVSKAAFARLLKENSARLNRKRWDLSHISMDRDFTQAIREYRASGDRSVIWDAINQRIADNRLKYENVAPFETVLSESYLPLAQTRFRHVFDAKANREFVTFQAPIERGRVRIGTETLSLDEARSATLRLTRSKGAEPVEIRGEPRGGILEFQLALPQGWTPAASSRIELVSAQTGKPIAGYRFRLTCGDLFAELF